MRTGGGVEAWARCGALRLLTVALTLAGFVAMHGLSSTGSGGSHCAPPIGLISSVDTAGHGMDVHSVDGGSSAVAPEDHHEPVTGSTITSAGSTRGDGDEVVFGCLLALLGGLVALVLRLLRLSAERTASGAMSFRPSRAQAARAPPPPLFLSLCVFRL